MSQFLDGNITADISAIQGRNRRLLRGSMLIRTTRKPPATCSIAISRSIRHGVAERTYGLLDWRPST